MTVASESVESQRKGIVKIVHPTNPSDFGKSFPGPEDRKLAGVMNSSMPIRLVAFHICAPDSLFFRMFRALIILTKSGDQKYRVLTHFGMSRMIFFTYFGFIIYHSFLTSCCLFRCRIIYRMAIYTHGVRNSRRSAACITDWYR